MLGFSDFLCGFWNDADRPIAFDSFNAPRVFAIPSPSTTMSFDEYAPTEWCSGLANGDVGLLFAASVSAFCVGNC